MGVELGNPNFAMTKKQYDDLEKAGKLTRPISSPTMRRVPGALNAAPDTPTKGDNDRWTLS